MKFILTDGFNGVIVTTRRPGPQKSAQLDAARCSMEAVLLRIEPLLKNRLWLRHGHIQQASHVRKNYPPPRLGAFLERFEAITSLGDIAGLTDKDPESWMGFYHHTLSCPVLYSEVPHPFLAFLAIGERPAIATAAKADLGAATIKATLNSLRRQLG